MKPGVYYDISFEEYKAIDAVNSSSLKNMAVSALAYKHGIDNERKETASMAKGSAVHSKLLEPEKFASECVEYEGRRAGKDWTEFKELNAGKSILNTKEMQGVDGMAEAVSSHPIASNLLDGGKSEVTIIFEHASTGILCKARLDKVNEQRGFLVDLKSTRCAAPFEFSRQAAQLLYHFQFAFYYNGYLCATGERLPFKCIAVENSAPFDVAVYNIAGDFITPGQTLVTECMEKLAKCRATDTWPGVCTEEMYLELPYWMVDDQQIGASND